MAASSCFLYIFIPVLMASVGALKLKTPTYPPLILVSIDGLGWQFTGGKFANTPNLDFVAKSGVKAKYMKTVTPTKTWPNHQTYVTGLYPESHGIVSNRFWDPLFKEKFIFDYDCSNNDPKFWNEAEPIWLSLQKGGRDTGLYYWPGFSSYDVKPTYYEKAICLVNCSAIPAKDLPSHRNRTRVSWPGYIHCFPNYTQPFPRRIDGVIEWLTSANPPQFVGFYADQPDWVGHSNGPNSPEFKAEVEKVDRDVVGYLITQLRNAKLLDKVNLIFVSDHSFTTVNRSRLIFLEDFLDASTYTLTESGPIGHLWPNSGKLEEIYINLTTKLVAKYPQAKVYKKEQIPWEYHFKNNRRIPPLYVDPGFGWMIEPLRSAYNVSADWVYGVHGYPASKEMGAIFYARGPAFKKGYLMDRGLRSIDVYPLMCKILGLEPRPNNGSLDNMLDMMQKDDPSGEGCVASWSPVVLAITLAISLLMI